MVHYLSAIYNVTEGSDIVSIYYEYQKTDGNIIIAQLFRLKHHKISELLPVFDTRAFA